MSGDSVSIPIAAARALYGVYDTWWHQVGTGDPGDVLISDGTVLHDIGGLLTADDASLMEAACEAVEPHAPLLRSLLGELEIADVAALGLAPDQAALHGDLETADEQPVSAP